MNGLADPNYIGIFQDLLQSNPFGDVPSSPLPKVANSSARNGKFEKPSDWPTTKNWDSLLKSSSDPETTYYDPLATGSTSAAENSYLRGY